MSRPSPMRNGDRLTGLAQNPWDDYWERLRDNRVIFRENAREYVQKLEAAVGLSPDARVLDFGCGFGFVAEVLAARVGEVMIWDASANMGRVARARLAGRANVKWLDMSAERPDDQGARHDLVLVNSVVQYMDAVEFSSWLVRWRDLLSPGGRIVVSDVVPPDHDPKADVVNALRFAHRNGFFIRAVGDALRDTLGYVRTRRRRPLLRLGREEMERHGAAAGLTVAFVDNLTALTTRLTAVYAPIDPPGGASDAAVER